MGEKEEGFLGVSVVEWRRRRRGGREGAHWAISLCTRSISFINSLVMYGCHATLGRIFLWGHSFNKGGIKDYSGIVVNVTLDHSSR